MQFGWNYNFNLLNMDELLQTIYILKTNNLYIRKEIINNFTVKIIIDKVY